MDTREPPRRRGLFRRRWMDMSIAGAALFVSAVSLWVGIRTEEANEKLVMASTWPFLQVVASNSTTDGKPILSFSVVNEGVGPAKIESFEVFWKGRPFSSVHELMETCCGYRKLGGPIRPGQMQTKLLTGSVQGIVLRSGESEAFVIYNLGPDNVAVWNAMSDVRAHLKYRLCYCSALDECWRTALTEERVSREQLHPERVQTCPVPKVAFTE
jgi:hypothetical protein